MSTIIDDLRFSLRSFWRNPGLALVVVAVLALGIGATTAIFSVVSGVLLRPLPYPHPDRLMQVQTVFQNGYAGSVSYPDFEDLREQNHSFGGLAAYSDWTTTAAASGEGFRVDWAQVSPGFFSVLGVAPVLGRSFDADEARTGRPVAVVSWSYWQSRLGGAESLAGQTVRVNDKIYPVIGVMPRGYDFPAGVKLWVPREPATESRTAENWRVVGRLRAGASLTAARQDLTEIAHRLKRQYGDDTAMTDVAVRPILEQLVGRVRSLSILLGASGLLLLVACVNVANLLLARGLSRDRESAVRLALGAPPARLVRTVLAESLLLSLAGAALGLVVALAGVPALL
jgi:putative ABC transport system permease protein